MGSANNSVLEILDTRNAIFVIKVREQNYLEEPLHLQLQSNLPDAGSSELYVAGAGGWKMLGMILGGRKLGLDADAWLVFEPTLKLAEYMKDLQDHSKNTKDLHAFLIIYCLWQADFSPMRRDSARTLQRRRRVYLYVTEADTAEIFCGKVVKGYYSGL